MGGTVCRIRAEDPALEAGQVQQREVHLSCLTRSGQVHSGCTAGLGHHPQQALLSPSLHIIFFKSQNPGPEPPNAQGYNTNCQGPTSLRVWGFFLS